MHQDVEAFIPITAVPNHLPLTRSGKRIHIQSIYRWIHTGLNGRKLPAVWIGGRLFVHRDALRDFLRPVGCERPAVLKPPGVTLPTQARRILDDAGIGGQA
jgi:hypothetical protein